jgi:hypothetical protein
LRAAGGEPARQRDRRRGGSVGAQAAHVPAGRFGARAPGGSANCSVKLSPGGTGRRGLDAVDAAAEPQVQEAGAEAHEADGGGAVDLHLGRRPAADRSGQRPGAVGRGVDLGA